MTTPAKASDPADSPGVTAAAAGNDQPPMPSMPTAMLLAIGDEVCTGLVVDSNSAWVARELTDLGFRILGHIAVPDDRPTIARTLAETARTADFLFITGGLGPTRDDLTRFAVADVLGEPLIEDEQALAFLRRRWSARGQEMPPSNAIQALRPQSAEFIRNTYGTAPGIAASLGRCQMFFMPGVPRELQGMFTEEVRPRLGRRTLADLEQAAATASASTAPLDAPIHDETPVTGYEVVRVAGMPESELGERIADLMERGRNPLVSTLPSDGVIRCRIRAEGPAKAVRQMLDATATEIERRIGPYAFCRSNVESLADALRLRLSTAGRWLATAESCTGGLIAEMLTEVPGSSSFYAGGWVTYANEMKVNEVGVDPETLRRHGAVSAEVAAEMALGALQQAEGPQGRGADYALSVTGIAGPGGGRPDKPVGTVYIGLASFAKGDPTVRTRTPSKDPSNLSHSGNVLPGEIGREGALGDGPRTAAGVAAAPAIGSIDFDRTGTPLPRVLTRRFRFGGPRDVVRLRAANTALTMLELFLATGEDPVALPKQLWQDTPADG